MELNDKNHNGYFGDNSYNNITVDAGCSSIPMVPEGGIIHRGTIDLKEGECNPIYDLKLNANQRDNFSFEDSTLKDEKFNYRGTPMEAPIPNYGYYGGSNTFYGNPYANSYNNDNFDITIIILLIIGFLCFYAY